jgi:hypothetical protein
MKQFVFYKIKKAFQLILKKEMLYVFFDLITRNNLDEFEELQIDNLVDYIEKEDFESKLIEEFSPFSNFDVNSKGQYTISNSFTDDIEVLEIYDNRIELNCKSNNSKFLTYISLSAQFPP